MALARAFSEVMLVNGSTGDPALYLDYPGQDNAFLFDAGENGRLDTARLADLEAVFLTHHHVDHFIGFDRIVRANMDKDKVLNVFGPQGTIDKIYDRIKSYDYQFFPFQKITLRITELLQGVKREAYLECTRRFPTPEVRELPWEGRVIYNNAHLQIEAVAVDHTTNCYAYALAEKTGYHPDPEKLRNGLMRPANWVQEVLQRLRDGAPLTETIQISQGTYTLGDLAEQYFGQSPGARVVYITDTFWSDAIKPALIDISRGAWRLYCDSYYAAAQAKAAATHRHMMAHQAAELAKLAKVQELVLIHFSPRYVGKYAQLVEEAKAIFPRVSAEF